MFLNAMHDGLRALSRRQALGMALGAGVAAVAGCDREPAKPSARSATLDLTAPRDNVYAWCKTWGTVGDEPIFGGHQGVFFAVVGDRRAVPLFGYIGFGSLQFRLLPDGDALYRGKDATFYTDLGSGEIIDQWENPFTGERCRVYPYINDRVRTTMPVNYPVERFGTDAYRWQTSIGNAASQTETGEAYHGDRGSSGEVAPFVLPWRRVGNYYLLSWDWMLEIVNPVNPDGWPESSSGYVINPSEHFTFFVPAGELEDRSRPWATMTAGFFRQTPWLPFMRMGKSGIRGRMFANSHSYKITGGLDNIPRPVRERLERDRPDMLEPPTDWDSAPISSSWGYYAKVVPPENPDYTPR